MSRLFDAPGDVQRWAYFSDCRTYRYALWRTWGTGPTALFVGLNPSTADEQEDDPTIRRCIRFARDWGHDGLVMANLFALRSTDPKGLLMVDDPVGPSNDQVLRELAAGAGVVIAAWGAFPAAAERARELIDSGVLADFKVLGLTAEGHPRHPLYMRADCRPLDPQTLEAAA